LITSRRVTSPRQWAYDAVALVGAVLLVVAASVVGQNLLSAGVNLVLPFPPLLAVFEPHVGPGTPVAAALAVLIVARGPELAARLKWRSLLLSAYGASIVWTLALAMVDGWRRGIVERLTSSQEYLNDVPRVSDIPAALATFVDHILTDSPGFWSTHVGSHPPGALLLFVGLDRIGLGGGGSSGVVVILVGASACVAVAVTVRACGDEDIARRALPFGIVLPGAVWVGVSADGLFAGVLAWAMALLLIGATSSGVRANLAALSGGTLLGFSLYLSYGLVLGVLIPVAAFGVTRGWRAMALGAAGAGTVILAFTAFGFWWFSGLSRVAVIYGASIAQMRPYAYFVWANLAALLFAVGPAVVVGVRRILASPRALPTAVVAIVVAALVAILLADISGMSKAEVERIWLPFAVWLVTPCALLSKTRYWLAGQTLLALAVNHLLVTTW
jgi:hypothetical protein